ncbi:MULTISPECIES: hypothetical protein [unclassified Saccharothrix]|uniref:hypothetical protein n=1 Tax=unclassified Saccharothrix TaxID=2593673 RepID=UPI00307DA5F6
MKAFLKAGILGEDRLLRENRAGTPQGSILSPLLSNVALTVLDEHIARGPGGPYCDCRLVAGPGGQAAVQPGKGSRHATPLPWSSDPDTVADHELRNQTQTSDRACRAPGARKRARRVREAVQGNGPVDKAETAPWTDFTTHISTAIRRLVTGRDWLHVIQLPAYAPTSTPPTSRPASSPRPDSPRPRATLILTIQSL